MNNEMELDSVPLSPSQFAFFSRKCFLCLFLIVSLLFASFVFYGLYFKQSQPPCIDPKEHADLTTTPPSSPALYWPVRSQDTFEKYHKHNCSNRDLRFESLDETLEIQRLLEEHQNPFNCANRKFFVMTSAWSFGFGSDMHVRAGMMMKALEAGRIFLEVSNQQWAFSASHCLYQTSPQCYFLPLSNCTLPAESEWKSSGAQMLRNPWNISPDLNLPRYLYSNATPEDIPDRVTIFGERWAAKDFEWWIAQTIRFTMRPNEFTLHEVIEPNMRLAFPPDGKMPTDIGSVFIRRGDKSNEATPVPTEDLMRKTLEIAGIFGVKALYVSSDSPEEIDRVRKSYTQLQIYYLPAQRHAGGWVDELAWMNPGLETSRLGPLTIADVFIAANCAFFVGTSSSNQCRLINELRLTSGNTCMLYQSLG